MNIVSTVTSGFLMDKLFNKDRYDVIFNELRNLGNEVKIIPYNKDASSYNDKLRNADFIFHLSGSLIYHPNTLFPNQEYYDSIKALNELIQGFCDKGVIMETDLSIFHKNANNYELMNANGIPNINRVWLSEWEKNKFFPAVFKKMPSSGGKSIYYIENEKDFNNAFMNETSKNYLVSKFISCLGEYYNHFRTITLGSEKVIASSLNYSSNKKEDSNKLIFNGVNLRKIASNHSSGGHVILLNSNEETSSLDNKVLSDVGITDKQLPERLNELAIKNAKTHFRNYGNYILGQDWIKDENGDFKCIEVNIFPDLLIFDPKDECNATIKGAKIIAKELHDFLKK